MNQPIITPNHNRTTNQSTSTLKDLVFNPETGDFEQVERGTANEGDTVIKMSIDRFALTLDNGVCAHKGSRQENEVKGENQNTPNLPTLVFNPKTGEFELGERDSANEGNIILGLQH